MLPPIGTAALDVFKWSLPKYLYKRCSEAMFEQHKDHYVTNKYTNDSVGALISVTFTWDATKEGWDYWHKVSIHYHQTPFSGPPMKKTDKSNPENAKMKKLAQKLIEHGRKIERAKWQANVDASKEILRKSGFMMGDKLEQVLDNLKRGPRK